MKKMNKKGVYGLEHLPGLAVIFLVTAIVFSIALIILASFATNSSVTSNGAASKAVNASITAVAEIPNNWLDLIAIVVAAAFLVTITVAGMMYVVSGTGGGRR